MKRNMGTLDRVLRILVALILGALYLFDVVQGTLGIVLLIIAGILLVTGLIGYCHLYTLLGISTQCKKESA